MGSMKINFAEVDSGFDPIPEGEYECQVERIEVRESNSSDNDYLNWEFKVLDPEWEDRRLWMITSLSPRALFRLKDVFVALGVIEEDEELELEWDEEVDITPKEGPALLNPVLDGTACAVTVENEVYEGREQNRVRVVRASNGSAPKKKASSKKSTSKSKSSGRSRKLR